MLLALPTAAVRPRSETATPDGSNRCSGACERHLLLVDRAAIQDACDHVDSKLEETRCDNAGNPCRSRCGSSSAL